MRDAFAQEIENLASQHKQIVLLSGDIGNHMFDSFKNKFSNRFYNVGIAESNMTGLASGLALSGLKPFTYTITAFNTVRCLEQIRVDIAFQNLPVVIVGVGGGLSYANLNATHHSLEDIAVTRVLPNMTVICPGDPMEVRAALRSFMSFKGPIYMRLGKKGEPNVHSKIPDFTIGKAINIRSGSDACILSCGVLLSNAIEASDYLQKDGVSTAVYSFHTVKPLDVPVLKKVFENYKFVFTLEEHGLAGGFGSAISEWLTDTEHLNQVGKLTRIGTPDEFIYGSVDQELSREHFAINTTNIHKKILSTINS